MMKTMSVGLVAGLVARVAFAAMVGVGPADEALPIVGTDNTKELSNGNLYPCIARPRGAHG